ncbi:hypothetical protein AAU61_03215 [Desulfocarbo indianensis]|nr:hypothetical protein AAU61_03215 [Desulfocarbo indianensis]
MEQTDWLNIIKEAAGACGYEVNHYGENGLELDAERKNAISYYIKFNSSGYLEVSEWEWEKEEYGRAVYSLRDLRDVIRFCNIATDSFALRAKR